jgi:hypothetical protein
MDSIINSNPVKILPAKLRKNGFDYTLILRGERSFIYRQTYCPKVAYYEVFEIRVQPQKHLFGTIIPEKEVFPPDEAFGAWAWSFRDFDEAKKHFNKIELCMDMLKS